MGQPITWVAMDTSKTRHCVAILGPDDLDPRERVVPNEPGPIRRLARSLVQEAIGEVRVCYEAGPCGFALARQLEEATSGLRCEVIAPALIPVRPGDRVKTDRRDARKLVRLYRAGELTVVRAPTEQEEAVRDLVRCREDAKADLLRTRHRLAKFLIRRGRVYPGRSAWTVRHALWLGQQTWDHPADQMVFEEYRLAISQVEDRVHDLDRQIEAISQTEPYREPVGWLRCFRGIDTIIAMTILTEVNDFQRFQNPRSFMAFLGLVPSERSSASRVHRGGITKAGNIHARRIFVEAAWSSRHKPTVGYHLRKRREGQPAWVIAQADRAMRRLYVRQLHLRERGKPLNKTVIAVAREIAGCVWAVMHEGLQQQTRGLTAQPPLATLSSVTLFKTT